MATGRGFSACKSYAAGWVESMCGEYESGHET